MQKRAPRFRRVPDPAPIVITSRDEMVLRHVFRHRFLRSDQIVRLLRWSPQSALRRLQLLYHNGFLDRPESQRRCYASSKNRPMVYAIGKKGIRHLQSIGMEISYRAHENVAKDAYMEHTLLIAEFMSRLETELPPGVTLHYGDEIPEILPKPCSWKVPITYGGEDMKIGIVPDRVFAITTNDQNQIFCLEADRGSMPVIRSNPRQSSFFRKILAYHQTWKQALHKTMLGWNRFRVLTLTSSEERHDHLVDICKDATRGGGSGLFLFADIKSFNNAANVNDIPWSTGNGTCPAYMISAKCSE